MSVGNAALGGYLFFIRHSDKCLYAESALDNAVKRMVTARLVIPRHTSPLLFLHRVPPPINSPKRKQEQGIPECQENFMSVYSLNPKKKIPCNKWYPR